MGDGAGILILEEYERAKARGARIYCELAGFGMSGDAYHMTAPSERRRRCGALHGARDQRRAASTPSEIGYINAHGTSTPRGDLAETMAIKRALGDHAYKTMVSSTKSMTGHLLGAAGGVEAIFSVAGAARPASFRRRSTSTIRAKVATWITCRTRRASSRSTSRMSNSFGFGGTNGTLVFRRI